MEAIFLIGLVVGGGLLGLSLLGGDADMDMDMDTDVDFGGDGGDPQSLKLLSLRTLAYFLFGAGATGTALLRFSGSDVVTATVAAAGVGVALAVVAEAVFRYLKRTESGDTISESSYIGLPARVTVPVRPGQAGKVLVARGTRTYEFAARPFDGTAAGVEDWTDVMIVEMKNGEALVAPSDPGGIPTN